MMGCRSPSEEAYRHKIGTN